MIIYVAVFAGLLAAAVLALIWVADLYEREPLELIENAFVAGLVAQLLLLLAVGAATDLLVWHGGWSGLTIVVLCALVCRLAPAMGELDERFDGIVYAVTIAAGAACVSHMHNLPTALAVSPHADVFAATAAPDLRDLVLVLGASGPRSDLAVQLVLVLQMAVVGGCLGVAYRYGARGWRLTGLCTSVGVVLWAADQLLDGAWPARVVLAVVAIVFGTVLKRMSVHRRAPEAAEADLMVKLLKTALVVFGALTVSLALMVALSDSWRVLRQTPEGVEEVGRVEEPAP
jgi:hypothetical protein